jgi:hypothetical protein
LQVQRKVSLLNTPVPAVKDRAVEGVKGTEGLVLEPGEGFQRQMVLGVRRCLGEAREDCLSRQPAELELLGTLAAAGRLVRVMRLRVVSSGSHTATWDLAPQQPAPGGLRGLVDDNRPGHRIPQYLHHAKNR